MVSFIGVVVGVSRLGPGGESMGTYWLAGSVFCVFLLFVSNCFNGGTFSRCRPTMGQDGKDRLFNG